MDTTKGKHKRSPISPKLRFKIFERDNFTCQYCGEKQPNVTLEIDHIKPVSKGGENNINNLRTSCKQCNIGKGAMIIGRNRIMENINLYHIDSFHYRLKTSIEKWEEGIREHNFLGELTEYVGAYQLYKIHYLIQIAQNEDVDIRFSLSKNNKYRMSLTKSFLYNEMINGIYEPQTFSPSINEYKGIRSLFSDHHDLRYFFYMCETSIEDDLEINGITALDERVQCMREHHTFHALLGLDCFEKFRNIKRAAKSKGLDAEIDYYITRDITCSSPCIHLSFILEERERVKLSVIESGQNRERIIDFLKCCYKHIDSTPINELEAQWNSL